MGGGKGGSVQKSEEVIKINKKLRSDLLPVIRNHDGVYHLQIGQRVPNIADGTF